MQFIGTIIKFDFAPMVPMMKSWVTVDVQDDHSGMIQSIREVGSIPALLARFGGIEEQPDNYNFINLTGSKWRYESGPAGEYRLLNRI